ncbi:DUF3108 domain-containing protein [Flavobacterium enshiense]|uniref:DUF3108 domain-containing protein n=1 Tax=Flavobacterium enshiense TaxID=1341165 RepID=UPI00345E01DB
MRKTTAFFFALTLFISAYGQAQTVKSGEKLVYSASYNMSGLMTQVAQVTMTAETVNTSKNSYLHLSCQAATFSKWDSFFKIRDLYESYVNPKTFRPSLYKRNIHEGKYTKKEKYVFKNNGKTITSTLNKKNMPERVRTFNINPASQDVVSLLYKIRTLDFSKMKAGQMQSFTVVFDEKEVPVYIKYMGKETADAGTLGKKECHKISIGAKTQALKGKDKNLIWLTADTKKIPALIRFSIPVGTGQINLTSASGL